MKRVRNRLLVKIFDRLFFVHFVLYLIACTATETTIDNAPPSPSPSPPPFSVRYDEPFKSRPIIIGREELHKLTPQQEQEFLAYFHVKVREKVPAHERVAGYLEHFIDNFNYKNETNTATKTLALSQGNCLSLAILTTAIANLANVEVGYQLADSTPVFRLTGKVIFKGLHIRSILYDPDFVREENRYYFRPPGLLIDYFPSGSERLVSNIAKSDYISRYYLNMAAASISTEDYSTAYWLTIESLNYRPLSSEALNTLGVIYRRSGEYAKAEDIYRFGIEKSAEKLSLLKNYRFLLTHQKRYIEADFITRKIEEIDEPSPFDFIYSARESYDSGYYREAITLYKRALRMAPYIHEARLALAQSHYKLGQMSAAEEQLREAIEYAEKPAARSLYQAKLRSLTTEIN